MGNEIQAYIRQLVEAVKDNKDKAAGVAAIQLLGIFLGDVHRIAVAKEELARLATITHNK